MFVTSPTTIYLEFKDDNYNSLEIGRKTLEEEEIYCDIASVSDKSKFGEKCVGNDVGGYDKNGYDKSGYDKGGYDKGGYDKAKNLNGYVENHSENSYGKNESESEKGDKKKILKDVPKFKCKSVDGSSESQEISLFMGNYIILKFHLGVSMEN